MTVAELWLSHTSKKMLPKQSGEMYQLDRHWKYISDFESERLDEGRSSIEKCKLQSDVT